MDEQIERANELATDAGRLTAGGARVIQLDAVRQLRASVVREFQLEARAISALVDELHPEWFDPEWNSRAHEVLAEVYEALTGQKARNYEEVECEAGEEGERSPTPQLRATASDVR